MEAICSSDFPAEDIKVISAFAKAAEKVAKMKGVQSEVWDFYDIVQDEDIDLSVFPKEGIVMVALWVVFLAIMRRTLPKSTLKYADVESFLSAYNGKFDDLDFEEKKNLFNTANWMNIMLKMVPARKNKGLAIQVVPKLVQGWQAKYVTGSGQKKTTADRVHIFETEGDVTAHHRGRLRAKATRYHPSAKKSFKRPISKLQLKPKPPVITPTPQSRRTLAIPAPAKVYSFRVPRVQFHEPVVSHAHAPRVPSSSSSSSSSSSGVIHFDHAETDGEVSDDDNTHDDPDESNVLDLAVMSQPDDEDFTQCLSLIRGFSGCITDRPCLSGDKLACPLSSDNFSMNTNFDFNFTPIAVTFEEGDGLAKPKLTRIFSWGTTATQVVEPDEVDMLIDGPLKKPVS